MTLSVCPAATIAAPIERVWALLTDPHQVGAWSDARLEEAVPDGPVQVHQRLRFSAAALGKRWPVVMTVTGDAPERHSLDLDITLPFGIVHHEHISVVSVGEDTTHVQYG